MFSLVMNQLMRKGHQILVTSMGYFYVGQV